MSSLPLLSLVTFLPLIGAGFILVLRGDAAAVARNARWIALWTSLIVFALSILLWTGFDNHAAGFQFEERASWMPSLNIGYHMGIDGISLFFVLLSTLLTPVCILSAWEAVKVRVKEYMIAFLVLETMMVGTFCALDMIMFYVFFEGVLIPMFLIIGVWGGARRVYSAFKFFLYTFLGSVLMLLAILALYWQLGTTDIPTALRSSLPPGMQHWLWLAFFASFAVKVPMWPVHTWLPDAHVEAPTAGSVILAGVLLKMGGYGFIRFSVPMFPDASAHFAPLIYALSVIAIIYTSLVALAQTDMKKLIAYSSVAHMGLVTIGVFTLSQQGVQGAMFQMLSHGIVSAALFLCVGVVYDRLHTRDIARYGGLADTMPNYAFVFMVFMLASVGLPGTSGFIGEFLALLGAFEANTWVALLATTSLFLGACYMLYLYRRVIFGKITREDVRAMLDLSWREKLIFAPLVALVFWMGIYPSSFLDPMKPAITAMIERGHLAALPVQHVAQLASAGAAPIIPVPDFLPALPEIFLAGAALALLLVGVLRGAGEGGARLVSWLGVLVLLADAALVLHGAGPRTETFGGLFVTDGFAVFMKTLILVGSALAILLSIQYNRQQRIDRFENPVLILLAAAGMLVMISANDLISLYLGFELQSLPLYVLAAFKRDTVRSTEAGLKYFVLGALSSGMLLFGASLIYGFGGSTSFDQLARVFATAGSAASPGLIIGIVFLSVGLAFKCSAVPFHMWTPDVYEGAPTPVTAFFAVAPKTAALALFLRVLLGPFGHLAAQWGQIIWAISLLSMALGAYAAISQSSIKRLMAYSSISHVGYALMGLAAGTQSGVQGLLVYMTIYLFMTVGAFSVILCMERQGEPVETIADLAGLSRSQPLMAAALAIFMFSLAGVPPLAGFFGKIMVFMAAIHAGLYWLATLGILTSVVGCYYYIRIVKIMYFDDPAPAFDRHAGGGEVRGVMALAALLILVFCLMPGGLMNVAGVAAHSLFPG